MMHVPPCHVRQDSLSLDDACLITPAEKAHISELDGSQLQQWDTAKIGECTERRRLLKTLYNDAAPINRTLPNEILMEIFGRLLSSEDSRDEGLKFLHICRLWRRLLLDMPEFWVDLLAKPRWFSQSMSQRQEDRLKTYLELTGSRPITLSLDCLDYFPLRLAEIVTPWSHRIASLTITINYSNDGAFLETFFSNGLPSLERLSVDYWQYNSDYDQSLIGFQRAHFPRLRSLQHPFGSFELGDVGGQLRDLELFYCRGFVLPGRDEPSTLTNVAGCCTSLETLFVYDTLPAFAGAPEHLRLSLPDTLHSLRIHDTDGEYLRDFLPNLIYPPTCVVDIHCDDSAVTFADGLLHRDSQPYRHLCTADEIRLSTGRTDAKYGTVEARVGGARRLCTKVKAGAGRLFADFAALFSQPYLAVTTLRIDARSLVFENDVKGSLRTLLAAFPNLVRLHVGECDGRRDIIPLLKEPAGSSGAQCACPRLEELRIDWLCADDQRFKPKQNAWCMGAPGGAWYNFGPAVFAMFCDIVERMLERRRLSGAGLKKLAVRVVSGLDAHYFDDERWDPLALRERLRRSLGDLLEDVEVFCIDECQ